MKKIVKGDSVKVLRGKFSGVTGEVSRLLNNDYVNVSNCTIKKHVKASEDQDGGILDVPAKIHVSNVMNLDKKGNLNKVSFSSGDSKKTRVFRVCKK